MATPLPIQLPADVNLDSPQFKLFTQAGRAARPFNAESFQKFLHEDIRHNYLPRSLSEPERNKAEWVEHLAALLGSITMVDVSNTPFPPLFALPESPLYVVGHPFRHRGAGEARTTCLYPDPFISTSCPPNTHS